MKLKTCKSARKRVKIKNKKLYRKSAYTGHLFRHKSTKQLRHLSNVKLINMADLGPYLKLLPYL
jgi:ribosomal protein L35